MIPYIDSKQLRHHLPYPSLIAALRKIFAESVQAPRRHVHTLSQADASTLLLMPVWQESQQLGVKLVTVVPENRGKSLPTVQALFILMDATSGSPIALMDGEQLTLRRTAAASALASDYLSRSDSQHLLLIGTGHLAPQMAIAHCIVRPIQTVTVWGRDAAKVQQTMLTLREEGLPPHIAITAATDLSIACRAADIICCATTSKQPLVSHADIKPGTHIDLVGGFKPDMREADDALITHAKLFVDTFDGALAEAGDLLQPLQAGLISAASVRAELAMLVKQQHAGRANDTDITVFKSVGTAIEDLCAANLAWSAIRQESLRDSPPV